MRLLHQDLLKDKQKDKIMFNPIKNLEKLNSITKYPSIPTYHSLGDKGMLQEDHIIFDGGIHDEVILTEKIDGTNVRIVFFSNKDYLIGQREEFIYAKGDRIINPSLGIVNAVKGFADHASSLISTHLDSENDIFVVYGELYGGKIGKHAKQYTSDRNKYAFRVFDIIKEIEVNDMFEWDRQNISSWREHNGQNFLPESELQLFSEALKFQLTPRIATIPIKSLPTSISEGMEFSSSVEEGLAFLENHIEETSVYLDSKAQKSPEGIVVRTKNRDTIAKMRYEDYNRTVRRFKSQSV